MRPDKVIRLVEYSDCLINRDGLQGDGTCSAKGFRSICLAEADNPEWWLDPTSRIEIDFTGVETLAPAWANEAFAYFLKYATPNVLLDKLLLTNISRVKMDLIKREINSTD